ncbi:MAG TPA: nitroreductase family deazaflavin-dependent oxidoreductase [Solirubrobacterales bacterium]|nr:nitroreductase family deazaflavin-dependent oxidoreductase [Solirubrobacterales bacterium]
MYLGPRSTRLHVALYRRSGGRLGGHVPGWPEARILLLDHTGARSGIERTSPVIFCEDGDTVAITASKAGLPENPAWFHNLKANPDTTIQVGPDRRPVHARPADDEERARLWPRFVSTFPAFDAYRRNAGRPIPILLLEPRPAKASTP